MNARRRFRLRFRLPDVNMAHLGGGHRASGLLKHKNQTFPAPDHTKFHSTLAVDRPLKPRSNRLGTVLRVTGNPNRVPTQALDFIMTAARFDVDRETGSQILEIEK